MNSNLRCEFYEQFCVICNIFMMKHFQHYEILHQNEGHDLDDLLDHLRKVSGSRYSEWFIWQIHQIILLVIDRQYNEVRSWMSWSHRRRNFYVKRTTSVGRVDIVPNFSSPVFPLTPRQGGTSTKRSFWVLSCLQAILYSITITKLIFTIIYFNGILDHGNGRFIN